MRDHTYSVFIAYHGSYSSYGTEQAGLRLKGLFEKRYPIKNCYCGPNTDEHLFTEHAEKVIPSSQLFLLVVNDNCPKDLSGAMSREQSGYLIGEITAFFQLVKRGERSKKDFAVYYAGNLYKNRDEAAVYIRKLLKDIDPDSELWDGNQYYVLEDIDMDAWINNRLVDRNKIVFSDQEYFPFEALENKIHQFINGNRSGLLSLVMESGMGKTTFIRYLSKYNKLADCEIFPIYLDNKSVVMLEEFIWDLSDQIRANKDGTMKKCSIMPINPVAASLADEFNTFLNCFKEMVYPYKKMLLIVDGLNVHSYSHSVKKILSLFQKVGELHRDIYIVLSMRPPQDAKLYHDIRTISTETFVVDKNNGEYLRFLYRYFNSSVMEEFSHKMNKGSEELFDAITPKNILAFSIYYKICCIYFSTKQEHGEMPGNFGQAIGFYYNYIKEKYDKATYNSLSYILTALSMMDQPVRLDEMKGFLYPLTTKDVDFSDPVFTMFLNYQYLSTDDRGENVLVDIHGETRERLLKDNGQIALNILAYARQNVLNELSSSDHSQAIFGQTILMKLVSFALRGNLLEPGQRQTLCDALLNVRLDFDWSKDSGSIDAEIDVLTCLLESNLRIPPTRLAMLRAYRGFDHYLKGHYVEAGGDLDEAVAYFQANEDAVRDAMPFYTELLTMRSTYHQAISDHISSVGDYEQAIGLYETLWKEGLIDEYKFIFNNICLGHVYGHAELYKKQLRQLKQSSRLLKGYAGAKLDKMNAFLQFGYAYLYYGLKKVKKAVACCDSTIAQYLAMSKAGKEQVFCGDIMECFALKVRSLAIKADLSGLDREGIREEANAMIAFADEHGFENIDFRIRIYEALAQLFRRDAALCTEYCNLILDIIGNCNHTGNLFDYYEKIRIRVNKLLGEVNGERTNFAV